MGLHRYSAIDAYTLEELKRQYQCSDPKGRILFLRKLHRDMAKIPYEMRRLHKDGIIPYEIALMAVTDDAVEVRQWFARHSWSLDYRDRRYIDGQVVYQFPERNLANQLKNDPDPLVRACLREHPDFGGWEWEKYFHEATPLERLALVRNPGLGSLLGGGQKLVEKIFDPDDTELGIDLDTRKELMLALLTNVQALKMSYWDTHVFQDDDSWYLTTKHFSQLWKLISKWPQETVPLQSAVYCHVGTDDKTKADIYRTCDVPECRYTILSNCCQNDKATLQLGMEDDDEPCRELAHTIAESGKELQVSQKPEELFGDKGRQNNILDDKINFIGRRLLSFQYELEDFCKSVRVWTIYGFVVLIIILLVESVKKIWGILAQ